MKKWTVDADDVRDIGEDLFHETPWISDFLAPENTSRLFLVGTKGFGKTLLLLAKRLRFERARSSFHLLPENDLVDKPVGQVRIFARPDIDKIMQDEMYWENVWLMAMVLAIHKASGTRVAHLQRPLSTLAEDGNLVTIMDVFPAIIDLSRRDYFRAQRDFHNVLVPSYRRIHTPIAAFVDNVDEYFDAHLTSKERTRGHVGATEKRFWYATQTGLAKAIRSLHGINHHIKIFASIRQEAFQQLLDVDPRAQQFEGSAIKIQYEARDLQNIFTRNLCLEPDTNLVEHAPGSAFERFFGSQNCLLWHAHVGEPEPIWDFILRHTLCRPRDLMSMGYALSQIPPEHREALAIKHAVHETSKSIALSYVNEISPHMSEGVDFRRLFALIPKNILTRKELEEISLLYNWEWYQHDIAIDDPNFIHIFGALFKTGLLGYITYLPTRQVEVQRFVLPGEKTFAPDRSLPTSEFYIVHPVLDAWLSELSPDYARHLDTLNIAGYNRTWRDKTALRGTLAADIVDYTRIMLNADLFRVFVHDLRKVAHKHCQNLEFFEVIQGDSLALVDRNPFNLISAIKQIAHDLWTGPYKVKLRVGCDYGIMTPMTLDGGTNGPPMGMAYRTAARLESLGQPDMIIMTEEFLTELRNINSAFAYQELHDQLSISLPSQDGLFNIKKNNATDPDMWKRLYYILMA
ncbi:MAG TPA: hypothetical protein VI542_17550 [Candidatus Tectomicrobia bacterium]